MNNYYVYVYCNTKFLYKVKNDYGIKYLPIYVGKGKDNRIDSHNKKSHNRILRKYIDKMRGENNDPLVFKIKSDMEEKEAYKLENEIIKNINVIYSGNGCLFNKYIDGVIYEIYDSDIINEIINTYDDMVLSDIDNRICFNPSFICHKPLNGEGVSKKETPLASYVALSETIKTNIMQYMQIGFTIPQCCSMFKIPYKQIIDNIDEDFIKKWVV